MNGVLTMTGIVLFASAIEAKNICHVPNGPARGVVQWTQQSVMIRDGALQIGSKVWTMCDGLPNPFPTAIARTRSMIVVGFRDGLLAEFDGLKFSTIAKMKSGRAIRSLAFWRNKLLIGTSVGLFILQEGQLRRSRHWVLGLRAIYALSVDRKDRLNIAAGPYGWWRKESARQARRFNRNFTGCFDKSDGRLRGVPLGGACKQPMAPPASGLPSAHVSMLAVHRGVLYVGHFDKGLARYQTAHQFRLLKDSPRFINALVSDGTTLWIGTARGLYKTRDGRRVERAKLRLPSDHINGLARAPGGTMWVATSRGIVGIHEAGIRIIGVQQGLPSKIVYTVAVDQRGRLWAGTARGVALFESSGTKTFTHLNGGLPHDWVTALRADGDCMWVGTYDAGIVRTCATGLSEPKLSGRPIWVNPHGLIPWGQEVLVATLGDGLLRVAHDGRIERIGGLPSEDVTAVVHAHGRTWIGTRGGLVSRSRLRTKK